jgi:WD40 repeat protein
MGTNKFGEFMIGWKSILPALMIGTIAINIPIVQVVAQTLSQENVAKSASKFVVRIDGGGGGTGFIIGKNGNRYKVLTNKHVVESSIPYSVTTTDNQRHITQNIRPIPNVDLAEIEFISDKDYVIAPLSADYIQGSKVYAYGWNTISQSLTERSSQIYPGSLSGYLPQGRQGYKLTISGFSSVPGMSGSPILNEEGKVIGIYGEFDVQQQQDVKFFTFSLGIPISTYQRYANAVARATGVALPPIPIKPRSQPVRAANVNFRLAYSISGHENLVGSVAISPDGKTIISGSWDKTIKVRRFSNGQLLLTLSGYRGEVVAVAISPDGQSIISGDWARTIKVWRLSDGQLLRTLSGHQREIRSVAISPDGQTIVSGSGDKTIKVWRLSDGQLLRTLYGHQEGIGSVVISPDGQTIVSGSDDKTIKVWRLSDGQLLVTLTSHQRGIRSVAISPDGQTIVSGSDDTTIKVWRLSNGQLLRTLSGHQDRVESVAISPDGKTIVSGSDDTTVKVWRLSP